MATIIGTIDDDVLNGTSGGDFIFGYDPNNAAATDGGDDTLYGRVGNDSLFGGNGHDTLFGGGGNDILNGGADADIMTGGVGNDTYYVEQADDQVIELAGEGTDELISTINLILAANIENLTLIGTAISGTGNAGNNRIVGNDRSNTLSGGAGGTDVLIGGAGDDTYLVRAATVTAIEAANGGTDTVVSEIGSYTLGANIENGELLASAPLVALDLVGNDLGNHLDGNDGDNQLFGMGGDDTLNGGAGNDRLFGGDGRDHLYGGFGDDYFVGGTDGDSYYGGKGGSDTVDYSGSAGPMRFSFSIAVSESRTIDRLGEIEHLIGTDYDDSFTWVSFETIHAGKGHDIIDNKRASGSSLFGEEGNDVIFGGSRDDTISGGAGDDQLDGGGGVDTLDYRDATTSVTVDLRITAAQNTGRGTGTDTITGFENLAGGMVADRLTGTADANVIDGGRGNDVIHGLDGDDTLIDGFGSDILDGGAGIDTLDCSAMTAALNISLGITTAQATGIGTDTITGIENLTGGSGADRLVGSAVANTILGGAGNDAIIGLGGDDTLRGQDGDDQIVGSAGNDILVGGLGGDELAGGAGTDVFVFETLADAAIGPKLDQIADFTHDADKIDLSAIDANSGVFGDQAFTLIGLSGFTGQAGQLRQFTSGGDTIVEGDVNGDQVADFQILLLGAHTMQTTDFAL